jgi:hypothetical protein
MLAAAVDASEMLQLLLIDCVVELPKDKPFGKMNKAT